MATRTTQVLSLGYFNFTLDSDQYDAGAEDAHRLVNRTFGSSTNPLYEQRESMILVDGNNDGTVDFGRQSYTSWTNDYIRVNTGAGLENRTVDTGLMYRAEVTYWDGTKATTYLRIIQDGKENLYVLPPPYDASQSEIDALTTKPITSFKILGIEQNQYTGLTLSRFGLPDAPHFICFGGDSLIETPDGPKRADSLTVGDLVTTASGAARPILWAGSRTLGPSVLAAFPKLRPIRIAAGALGTNLPEQDLLVSPQHRMLIRSESARHLCGASEVLIAARHLTSMDGVDVATDLEEVTYVHFLLDQHDVVYANGAMTESLYAGAQALDMVGPEARAEILALFPDLAQPGQAYPPARPLVRGREGRQLVSALKREKARPAA